MLEKNLIFYPKYNPLFLFFLFVAFLCFKWPDLSLPIWHDEITYVPTILWNLEENGWNSFLPWNYDPIWFMGHPFLHPLLLYTAFFIFGPSVFVAKAVSLLLSLFFLITLYKMTEAVFKCSVTALYSTVFTMLLPYFWISSSLILADSAATAFGFGTIYAFITKKYKSLLLFALGLGTIRESSLAFFVPLLLYGLTVPSQRRSLLYLFPGLIAFISHFFIFFLKTGGWIAHPYISGTLAHNPNPVFFDFSIIPGNIKWHFLPFILNIYPIAFLIISGGAIIGYFTLFFLKKKKISLGKEILLPLFMCVLWFSFWIMYPDQTERNYFPLLMFLIPLGIYFIVKVMPYFYIFLIAISGFLFIQTVYMTPYIKGSDYLKADILNAKAFISYFDTTYGNKIRNSEKKIFSSWPENTLLSFPKYEYVKYPINVISDCQFAEKTDIEKEYRAAVFRNTPNICTPFYNVIKNSDSFIQKETPFKNYKIFIHKDLL